MIVYGDDSTTDGRDYGAFNIGGNIWVHYTRSRWHSEDEHNNRRFLAVETDHAAAGRGERRRRGGCWQRHGIESLSVPNFVPDTRLAGGPDG